MERTGAITADVSNIIESFFGEFKGYTCRFFIIRKANPQLITFVKVQTSAQVRFLE